MASLTIRNLEEPLKARLRIRAATNGRSMADEARLLLSAALSHEERSRGEGPWQRHPRAVPPARQS